MKAFLKEPIFIAPCAVALMFILYISLCEMGIIARDALPEGTLAKVALIIPYVVLGIKAYVDGKW